MWVDATVSFEKPARDVFREFLPCLTSVRGAHATTLPQAAAFSAGPRPVLGCKHHPDRADLATEIELCERMRLDSPEIFAEQRAAYAEARLNTKKLPVFETPILAWRDGPTERALFDCWYSQIRRFSCRDQVGLPYALQEVAETMYRVHAIRKILRVHHNPDIDNVPVLIHAHET
jgi:hypothetical protein